MMRSRLVHVWSYNARCTFQHVLVHSNTWHICWRPGPCQEYSAWCSFMACGCPCVSVAHGTCTMHGAACELTIAWCSFWHGAHASESQVALHKFGFCDGRGALKKCHPLVATVVVYGCSVGACLPSILPLLCSCL
jgi:hypothetical protein